MSYLFGVLHLVSICLVWWYFLLCYCWKSGLCLWLEFPFLHPWLWFKDLIISLCPTCFFSVLNWILHIHCLCYLIPVLYLWVLYYSSCCLIYSTHKIFPQFFCSNYWFFPIPSLFQLKFSSIYLCLYWILLSNPTLTSSFHSALCLHFMGIFHMLFS